VPEGKCLKEKGREDRGNRVSSGYHGSEM
jgi:hypothetical protein